MLEPTFLLVSCHSFALYIHTFLIVRKCSITLSSTKVSASMELPPPPPSCSGCSTLWTLRHLVSLIVSSARQTIKTSKITLYLYTCCCVVVYHHVCHQHAVISLQRFRLNLFFSHNYYVYFIITMDSLIFYRLRYSQLMQMLDICNIAEYIGVYMLCFRYVRGEVNCLLYIFCTIFVGRVSIHRNLHPKVFLGHTIQQKMGWFSQNLL